MPFSEEAHAHAYAAAASRAERAIVRHINREREARGRPRVRLTRKLARTADAQSVRILRTDRLSHGAFEARMRASGVRYRRVGETLAFRPRTASARAIVAMWMASPSHRAELLDRRYRRIGVGRKRGALGSVRGIAVTADFASAR